MAKKMKGEVDYLLHDGDSNNDEETSHEDHGL